MEHRRLFALSLLAGATAALAAAFALPFVRADFALELPPWLPEAIAGRVRIWLVEKGRIPIGDHYLGGVIHQLFRSREYFVGTAILLFSVVFPVLKISTSAALAGWGHRIAPRLRSSLLHLLDVSARWSMADVFIVSMMIVFFKAEGLHFSFRARPGIYCYAAAALLSSAAVRLVQKLAQMEAASHSTAD